MYLYVKIVRFKNKMIGLKHLGIAVIFFMGTFLIDLDHHGLDFQSGWAGFIGQPMINGATRGFLHTPLTFYILLALTLGVGLHLLCDTVRLKPKE